MRPLTTLPCLIVLFFSLAPNTARADKLICPDVLAPADRDASIAVETLSDFGQPRAGVPITLSLAGESATAMSDQEGTARFSFTQLPTGLTPYEAHHQTSSCQGVLFYLERSTKILVTDIDETISDLDGFWVPFTPNESIAPIAHAQEVLTRLAQDYQILYLTARDVSQREKTLDWLAMYDFPRGPLYTNDWSETLNQEAFKTETLRELKHAFPYILTGVGDKPHDGRAYLANHLRAFLLGATVSGAETVSGWQEIEKKLRP